MMNELRKLAKEFDLKFNKNWFKHLWISKKENILLEYMLMCPDSIYKRYGKTSFERAKHIEDFLSSRNFKECMINFFT